MDLLVFTANGKVFKFSGVSNLMPSSQGFTFDYEGAATKKKSKAIFNHSSVAGYTILGEEIEEA